MKNIFKGIIITLAAVSLFSCAKVVSESSNQAHKRYLEAWISVHAPQTERAGRGIYVYPDATVEGDGATVEKDGFAIVRYVSRDLNGTITSYTDEEYAKQLGEYSESAYYGIDIFTTTDETIRAGISDALLGMKAGGKKKFIIPSWLMSYSYYKTEAEYFAVASDQNSSIFDLELIDFAKNINNWQLARMEECFNNPNFYNGAFEGTTIADSTSLGFYFKMLNKVENKKEYPSDTTIYINYTGKLLDLPKYYGNGLVFDTTIEKTAKDNYIWSSAKKYTPVSIRWAEESKDITMGESTLVSGFTQTLWNMANCAPGTKAVGVFYSDLGYGYNGSGSIPAYAPLVFEIEIVEKPE